LRGVCGVANQFQICGRALNFNACGRVALEENGWKSAGLQSDIEAATACNAGI
jgi:hypothetical protein